VRSLASKGTGQSTGRFRLIAQVVVLTIPTLLMPPAGRAAKPVNIGSLRLIGIQTTPAKMTFRDTPVGGLSGLDYDPASQMWIAESDDRSELNPARFYALKLNYDEREFRPVELTDVTFFRQADGKLYPDQTHAIVNGGEIPDLESIRFDPRDGSIWYTSEGDRALGMNPFVRQAARDGCFLAELPQPEMFRVHPKEGIGPRNNLSFEGLTWAPDGRTLWLAMEAPLYQDGPLPTVDAGAVSRFIHYDRAGKILGQWAYPLDPIPVAPAAGRMANNGVSEILAIDDHRFLVVERAGNQDAAAVFHFHIRLYEADLGDATDVSGISALTGAVFQPARKHLVLDFDRLGQPWVDNLEGIAWGPPLANGHPTLVLVSDDNFSADQQTQFWAFEVLPAPAIASISQAGHAAPNPPRWDEVFEGVVHDEKSICGFVAEYRWLSNFFLCRVEWQGRIYGSSEAAYQSAKYPPAERDAFLSLDPDAAKKLSRKKPYDTAAWEIRKEQCMREIVWAKFSQNPELAAKLRATGVRRLEETNWWGDKFWGVCQGEGKNVLGLMLMETRDRLADAKRAP